jgi:hypothetical protein
MRIVGSQVGMVCEIGKVLIGMYVPYEKFQFEFEYGGK